MTDPDLPTQIAAAMDYEATLVRALMREWAPRLVEAAGIQRGDRKSVV